MSEDLLAILVIVALSAVALLAVAVGALAVRLRRVRRDYSAAMGDGAEHQDPFASVRQYADDLAALRQDVGVVHENTEVLRDLVRDSVSRVAVVRYDAFEDMGGALSFSAALLDERGDGVIMSAINGRSETRTYAKSVRSGTSEHHLSDEETQAIRQAMAAAGASEGAAPGGRRRRRAG